MRTPNERLAQLEQDIVELRGKLRTAGAFPITAIAAVLDQMVDERLLPADTRAEIWGRIRQDIPTFRIECTEIADGATYALPHSQTKAEREASHAFRRDLARDHERLRREILSPKPPKDGADPVDD